MSTSYERYVKGTEEVLKNLNRELANIKGRISRTGMRAVLTDLEGEAMDITPVGPSIEAKEQIFRETGRRVYHIGTGNLKNSYSTYIYEAFGAIIGVLVNNALYALFVHEFPETYHFTTPGTGPKFVEKPLYKNQGKYLNMLRRSAEIP